MTEEPEAVKFLRKLNDAQSIDYGDATKFFAECPADIIAHIDALAERLKTADETLAFYGDEETYDSRLVTQPCECCTDIIAAPIEEDEGQRAREWRGK